MNPLYGAQLSFYRLLSGRQADRFIVFCYTDRVTAEQMTQRMTTFHLSTSALRRLTIQALINYKGVTAP